MGVYELTCYYKQIPCHRAVFVPPVYYHCTTLFINGSFLYHLKNTGNVPVISYEKLF